MPKEVSPEAQANQEKQKKQNNEFRENFVKLQSEMVVVKKDRDGHNGKYTSKEAVWEFLHPLLKKYKMTLTTTFTGKIHCVKIGNADANLYDLRMAIEDKYGNNRSVVIPTDMFPGGDQKKVSGQSQRSALTYFWRMAVECLFNLTTSSKDDAVDSGRSSDMESLAKLKDVKFIKLELTESQKEFFSFHISVLRQWEDIIIDRYPDMPPEDIIKYIRIALSKTPGKTHNDKMSNLTATFILGVIKSEMSKPETADKDGGTF